MAFLAALGLDMLVSCEGLDALRRSMSVDDTR